MSGTKKRQKQTKRNTKSTLKKQKASSTTQKLKSNTTKHTARIAKKGTMRLDTQKEQNVSSSSSANLKAKTGSESSLHEALQNLKKRSITDIENGGHGFISPTEEEKNVLKNSKVTMGRPKKSDENVKKVISFRLSLNEQKLLITWAKKHGYSNWKEYILNQAREEVGH